MHGVQEEDWEQVSISSHSSIWVQMGLPELLSFNKASHVCWESFDNEGLVSACSESSMSLATKMNSGSREPVRGCIQSLLEI